MTKIYQNQDFFYFTTFYFLNNKCALYMKNIKAYSPRLTKN